MHCLLLHRESVRWCDQNVVFGEYLALPYFPHAFNITAANRPLFMSVTLCLSLSVCMPVVCLYLSLSYYLSPRSPRSVQLCGERVDTIEDLTVLPA